MDNDKKYRILFSDSNTSKDEMLKVQGVLDKNKLSYRIEKGDCSELAAWERYPMLVCGEGNFCGLESITWASQNIIYKKAA